MTCTRSSPLPTLSELEPATVQPVSESVDVPVQVTIEDDGEGELRSSYGPATICSGEPAPSPSVDTGMLTPPLVGTLTAPVAKVFGSRPTGCLAGTSSSGSVCVGFTGLTSRPMPVLSPAARCRV